MTPFPAVSTAPVAGIGPRAARALTAEFARHNAATTALVIGADHASGVVAAAG
jgi:phosphatidylserine decarboxylase